MGKEHTGLTCLVNINPRDTLIKLVLVAFYILSMYLAYVRVLSPMYSYALLTLNINHTKMVISFLLVILCTILLPIDYGKPSTFLFYIMYSIIYLPLATYYWLNDQATTYFVYETICIIAIELLLRITFESFEIKLQQARAAFYGLMIFYFLACIYLIVINGGISLSALFSDLYLLRSENNFSGISGYILNWCAKSFMPLFFIYFCIKRSFVGAASTVVMQTLLFASYGFKAFFLAIIMLIAVGFLMQKSNKFCVNWTALLVVANFISIVFVKISDLPIRLLGYRTLFIPAQGQYEYYEFFTHNDFLYFSEGSIGKLIGTTYPYSESIGRVVNAYIYGPDKLSNGNTGAFSYGFADFGFIGMLLATFVIIAIFWLVDSSTRNLPTFIVVSAMAYQMYTFNDNNVLICLNTGGVVLTVILLMLINSLYGTVFSDKKRIKIRLGEN